MKRVMKKELLGNLARYEFLRSRLNEKEGEEGGRKQGHFKAQIPAIVLENEGLVRLLPRKWVELKTR